jgi:murein L,D-transpeptidase YafK
VRLAAYGTNFSSVKIRSEYLGKYLGKSVPYFRSRPDNMLDHANIANRATLIAAVTAHDCDDATLDDCGADIVLAGAPTLSIIFKPRVQTRAIPTRSSRQATTFANWARRGCLALICSLVFASSVPISAAHVLATNHRHLLLTHKRHHSIKPQLASTHALFPLQMLDLTARLEAKGLKWGDPIFVRIFKAESELELWIKKDDAFILFATYPICKWSGAIGPKLIEGDRRSPEGFYEVSESQLRPLARHPRTFNIGYPNNFDRALGRTGSNILVHGGCSSIGCFAMTDPVMDEIYSLAAASLANGQPSFHIHVYPFRLTLANLLAHINNPWFEFWLDLKKGYDLFEVEHYPPRVSVCNGRYTFTSSKAGPETGAEVKEPEAGLEGSECLPLNSEQVASIASDQVKGVALPIPRTIRLTQQAKRRILARMARQASRQISSH